MNELKDEKNSFDKIVSSQRAGNSANIEIKTVGRSNKLPFRTLHKILLSSHLNEFLGFTWRYAGTQSIEKPTNTTFFVGLPLNGHWIEIEKVKGTPESILFSYSKEPTSFFIKK